jgi:hypothetical protein
MHLLSHNPRIPKKNVTPSLRVKLKAPLKNCHIAYAKVLFQTHSIKLA